MSIHAQAAAELARLYNMPIHGIFELIAKRAFENPHSFVAFMTSRHMPNDAVWHQFVREGRILEAIKEYRSLYNEGLKASKDAIEKWGLDQGYYYRNEDGWFTRSVPND